jgi:GWxTD domain-containing protein
MRNIFFAFSGLLLLLSACVGTGLNSGFSLQNRVLNPVVNAMRTQFKVVHIGTKTYLLVYSEAADYKLLANAYNEYDSNDKIWDNSTTSLLPCPFAAGAQYLEIIVPEKVRLYALHLTVQNEAARYIYSDIIVVNRHQDNPQTLLAYAANGDLLANKYVNLGQTVTFGHASDTVKKFVVRYYPDALGVAAAPTVEGVKMFSPFKAVQQQKIFARDSSFTFDREGTYFVQTDTASNQGVFFYCTDADFPKMTRLGYLIESMRYITKNEEYQLLISAADQKGELDRYWLARSLDKERSRGLLRTYYRRAETANYYFTAETAGWRTDRGIIFIVFGKPKNIRKFANSEIWGYPQTSYRPPVEFVFKRTGEIFTLQRDPTYRDFWNSEIMQWRNGAMHLE